MTADMADSLAIQLLAYFGSGASVFWLGDDQQLAAAVARQGLTVNFHAIDEGWAPTVSPATPDSSMVLSGIETLPRQETLGTLLTVSQRIADNGVLAVLLTRLPGELLLLLETAGFAVERTVPIDGRWLVLAERVAGGSFQGLSRIQSILAFDRKTTTYKFALIRALSRIGRTEPHTVVWRNGVVHVPLRSLAVAWLRFFWPIITGPTFIAQLRGEHADSPKPLGIRRQIERLASTYGPTGLPLLLADLDGNPNLIDEELLAIATTIHRNPVAYSNTGGDPVFTYRRRLEELRDDFGWVAVPQEIWLDLVRFDHWIEDSVVVRWAELSAEMNPSLTSAEILSLLMDPVEDPRDTREVRSWVPAIEAALGTPVSCAWTGQRLRAFDIDHVVPFSVWRNNDLWNLLPASPATNNQKRDHLPSHRLLIARESDIRAYWRAYSTVWGKRFATQVSRALGPDTASTDWDSRAYAGLVEAVERLATSRGLPRWEPK